MLWTLAFDDVKKTVDIFIRDSKELFAFVDTYVAEEDMHGFFI